MAEILEKLVVRNVGVLKAFDTPNAPKLAKLTTIYARNGRGKSTLSAVLRAASAGDGSGLRGRKTLSPDGAEPLVTLEFETNKVIFKDGKWSQKSAPIEVFDSAFISENLHAGEAIDLEHDRGLFTIILGQAGVKLARHQEFFVGAAKRAATTLKEAETALQDDLPTDQTREEFFASSTSQELDDQIEQAQKDLKGIQQSDRLANLKKLEAIELPSLAPENADTLGRTISTIETSSREKLAGHFSKFKLGKQGEAWVRFGLDHAHEEDCPFCGKAGVDDLGLVTLYGQIFGDEYKAHFELIKTAAEAVDTAMGPDALSAMAKTIASNAESIRSWAEFYSLGSTELPELDPALTKLDEVYQAIKAMFDAKRQTPLAAIVEIDVLAKADALLGQAVDQIRLYNDEVAKIDQAIKDRRSAPRSTEAQANARLANLNKRKRRSDAGVQKRIDNFFKAKRRDTRAKKFRTEVQTRLKAANETAAAHYHKQVNDYLEKFGATFSISKISNSMSGNAGSVDYGLIVRGHSVARGRGRAQDDKPTFKNTLSTGDKTTLAFAFFLAGLDRLTDLSKRVIVFDDPLSSHDSHRQKKTIELLSALCGRCAQVIVLSHDEHFLRKMSKRCSATNQASYQIEHDGADKWSKAKAVDLDELCQSESAAQLAKLKAYYETRTGQPSDVAPAIRKVLETHFRRAYSAYFKPEDNLGPIIRKINDAGSAHPCWDVRAELEACNVGTMAEHHGEDPTFVSTGPIDPDELHVLVGECLLLVNARIKAVPASLAVVST